MLASGLEVGQRPGADLSWAGWAQLKERSVEWRPWCQEKEFVCQSSL